MRLLRTPLPFALVVLAAGCGDGGPTPGPIDASTDARSTDAGRDAVAIDGPITPLDGGEPTTTIPAIQDPDHPDAVAAGAVVRIEGAIVTAIDAFEERGAGMFTGDVWIADAAGGAFSGLHVYMPTTTPCTGALALGDVVTVTGTVQEFAVPSDGSGRTVTQLVSGTVTCTAPGDPIAPASIDPAELLDDATAERWEGVLIELDDVEASGEADAFGSFPLREAPPVDDDLYRHPIELRHTFVRVAGIFHYMHGRWAIQPRAASDLELGAPRVIEWESGQWGCADGADGDGDGAIDCDDADCAALRFCRGPVVRVEDVQDPASTLHPTEGSDVTLRGPLVVTAIDAFEEMPGSAYVGTVVVQDPAASGAQRSGIHVFLPTIEACGSALALGDRVYVAGRYREYADASDSGGTLTEIEGGIVSCRMPGAPLDPTPIATPSTLGTALGAEPWEGVLVELRDVVVTMPSGTFGRFVVTGEVAVDDDLHRATVVLGDRITRIAGIVTYAFEPQLEPRSAADVVIAPSERNDTTCGNGTDDDLDGAIDCLDLDCCATVPCAGAVPGRDLILSEVLYDASAADDEREWVELRNAGTTPVPLACYALGNGTTSYRYSIAQLPAITIPAGGCVVIGGPDCGGGPCTSTLDFEPDLHNGPTASDAAGVALLYGVASSIGDASTPVDAVIYGTANTGMLRDASGTAPLTAHVADAPAGSSLERTTTGAWALRAVPMPGTCTTFTPP